MPARHVLFAAWTVRLVNRLFPITRAAIVPTAVSVAVSPVRSTVLVIIASVAPIIIAGHKGAPLGDAGSGIAEHSVGTGNSATPDEERSATSRNTIDDPGGIGHPAEPVLSCTRHKALRLGIWRNPQKSTNSEHCRG